MNEVTVSPGPPDPSPTTRRAFVGHLLRTGAIGLAAAIGAGATPALTAAGATVDPSIPVRHGHRHPCASAAGPASRRKSKQTPPALCPHGVVEQSLGRANDKRCS